MTAWALVAMGAAAGCVFLGRAASFRLSQRESLLDDWARALRRMENEAVYRQSSALRTIAQGAAEGGPAGAPGDGGRGKRHEDGGQVVAGKARN